MMEYLISHGPTDDEVIMLCDMDIFAQAVGEGNSRDVKRCKASDLCKPSEKLQGLGLPVLAWEKTPHWNDGSEEGKLPTTCCCYHSDFAGV